jgi:hypothetical protein
MISVKEDTQFHFNLYCIYLTTYDWIKSFLKITIEGRAIYGNLENKINTLYWPVENSIIHIHIYSEPGQVHLAYVVSVIDYNISLFRTASMSNYAIIDYTILQSPGIWNFPLASKAY